VLRGFSAGVPPTPRASARPYTRSRAAALYSRPFILRCRKYEKNHIAEQKNYKLRAYEKMNCQELQAFKNQLAQDAVTLVAVSKNQTVAAIDALYNCGQRVFGENRAQELLEKQAYFQALGYRDIDWHFIGHLQRNKVKYIAPFISLIHSVDSLDLLKEINKEAKKNGRIIDCLLQFYVAEEETKFGLDWAEAEILMQTVSANSTNSTAAQNWQNVRIVGIMGMASQSSDKAKVAAEFAALKQYFTQLKQTFFADAPSFTAISMGMSGDYPLAVAAGSTLVRIGTMLFA
jgi:hypothetical protein